MIITNRYNLPEPLFLALSRDWPPRANRVSVTDMLNAPCMKTLRCKHWPEIVVDASDRLYALLGQGVHGVLEGYLPRTGYSERKIEVQVGPFTVVGRIDVWNNEIITDWKVTSVWSFLMGGKAEWEVQLNLYKYLYDTVKLKTKKLQIYAILRDHVGRKAEAQADYPDIPFVAVDIPIWPDGKAEQYVKDWCRLYETSPMHECSPAQKFQKKNTWAVKKTKKSARASKVCESLEEAKKYLKEKVPKGVIEERPGEYGRCKGYCDVRAFCPYNPYREAA